MPEFNSLILCEIKTSENFPSGNMPYRCDKLPDLLIPFIPSHDKIVELVYVSLLQLNRKPFNTLT